MILVVGQVTANQLFFYGWPEQKYTVVISNSLYTREPCYFEVERNQLTCFKILRYFKLKTALNERNFYVE
jgi:hypothetical protein